MNKITAKKIILSYLKFYSYDVKIPFSVIEIEIYKYALSIYGKVIKPGTISRVFRKMREDKEIEIEFTDESKRYFIIKKME